MATRKLCFFLFMCLCLRRGQQSQQRNVSDVGYPTMQIKHEADAEMDPEVDAEGWPDAEMDPEVCECILDTSAACLRRRRLGIPSRH